MIRDEVDSIRSRLSHWQAKSEERSPTKPLKHGREISFNPWNPDRVNHLAHVTFIESELKDVNALCEEILLTI